MNIARLSVALGLAVFAGVFSAGCQPQIDPANFVSGVDNPYFPLVPGTTFVYEADTPDGLEHVEVAVTSDTKVILGVTCVLVHDRKMLDGVLAEDTYDWYAQDVDGNVWYFGEDSKRYEQGVLAGTEGSWEAGINGAEAGFIMEAIPQIGDHYRQEYLVDVAEDEAGVVALSESASVPFDSYSDCLKTRESTRLEPGVEAFKFYARGVGQVLTVEGDVREELIDIIAP